MPLLELKDVECAYGRIRALRGISLHVDAGEIVTLIGANGAGKTTTLRAISGLLRPAKGSITFDGMDCTSTPPARIVRHGLSHSPEGRRVFARMTVRENLELGAFTRASKAEIDEDIERIFTTFPRLKERIDQKAGTLSGGEQQMLAIARVLRTGAKLVLMDEPTEGLAPVIVERIGEVIRTMKQDGITILLVEQNVRFATGVADRHHIVVHGRVVQTLENSEVVARERELLDLLGV